MLQDQIVITEQARFDFGTLRDEGVSFRRKGAIRTASQACRAHASKFRVSSKRELSLSRLGFLEKVDFSIITPVLILPAIRALISNFPPQANGARRLIRYTYHRQITHQALAKLHRMLCTGHSSSSGVSTIALWRRSRAIPRKPISLSSFTYHASSHFPSISHTSLSYR